MAVMQVTEVKGATLVLVATVEKVVHPAQGEIVALASSP
jgi:hypothetical protein